jgi:nucleoside-diphosphate-sugar epimerase
MRRILVTGGAGFTGATWSSGWSRPARTWPCSTTFRGRREWLPPGTKLHELDLRDGARLRDALREAAPETVASIATLCCLHHSLSGPTRDNALALRAPGERQPLHGLEGIADAWLADRALGLESVALLDMAG